MEEANQFLPKFIEEYNRKFGKEPRTSEDAHRSLRSEDDLERFFSRRAVRKLSKSLSFQYEGVFYQVNALQPNRLRSTHVNILQRPGKPSIVESGGKEQSYTIWKDLLYEKLQILDAKPLEAH